jgi:hypothetical protein
MPRPPKCSADLPVLVFNTEIRIYASEPDLLAYFQQFRPRQYATAVKLLARAALSGGGLSVGSSPALSGHRLNEFDDHDGLDDFVS